MLRDANKNGFDNDVGGVTNKCTGMYDVISQFEEGTEEYNEMMYRIICMQGYQQEVIDSIKGIIAKQVPKHWYNYKSLKVENNDTEDVKSWKLQQQKYASFKKPYFFIYNYPHVMQKYNTYIKVNDTNCKIRFGVSVNELKNKNNKTKDEEEFLYYYDLKMPVSMRNSTMNRICWKLEKEFCNIKEEITEFDKNILKTELAYNKPIYNKVKDLYMTYKSSVQQYKQDSNNDTKEEKQQKRNTFILSFIEESEKICSNSEMLCNILIDMCYVNNESKQFVWDICGEQIIDNLLKKNNNKITYPVLSYDNNDTEWNGSYYKLKEDNYYKECVEDEE